MQCLFLNPLCPCALELEDDNVDAKVFFRTSFKDIDVRSFPKQFAKELSAALGVPRYRFDLKLSEVRERLLPFLRLMRYGARSKYVTRYKKWNVTNLDVSEDTTWVVTRNIFCGRSGAGIFIRWISIVSVFRQSLSARRRNWYTERKNFYVLGVSLLSCSKNWFTWLKRFSLTYFKSQLVTLAYYVSLQSLI